MKRKSAAAKALDVTIAHLGGDWGRSLRGYKRQIEGWARAALKDRGGSLSVVLADDATLKELNHSFRGKNKPTNVLSFEGEGEELGDVILAYETVKREAREQGKAFAHHAAHLIVHGCLHLLGHDHMRPKEAEKMEAIETKILAGFHIPDPYIVSG